MKFSNLIFSLSIIILILAASPAHSATIHVPADQPTIQAGIDAAIAGDTVLVADGTYTGDGNRDIDFGGKGIVLKSENGPEVTIIDCQGSSSDRHRGFYFHSGEDTNTVVAGFTILNGWEFRGGGIRCDSSSSPKIINNTISGNSAGGNGGGIYCGNSNPTISNNTISGNTSTGGNGGGIYCIASSPTISNNTISGNTSPCSEDASVGNGGGIYCVSNSNPTISNNNISGNTSGGISCWFNSNPTISNNTISGNTARSGSLFGCGGGEGGGIFCYSSNPTISNNTINGNSTNNGIGGGISCSNSSNPIISNNTISGNSAILGGGIYCLRNSNPIISNNIITYNFGSGVYLWNSSPVIVNTIILSNSGIQVDTTNSSMPLITHSDIQGGWEGEGNIDADPLFVGPNGNVCSQSPCIDAGDPSILDPDGSRSDIGLFFSDHPECSFGNTWYVSVGGSDSSGDGTLGNPFRTIQYAVDLSLSGDTVVVGNGTYVENIIVQGKSILMTSNYLYSEDTLDIKNTVIDGDSASTVITLVACDSLSAITGFTIRNGRGDRGGGISCFASNTTITANTISGNSAGTGGGISCRDNSSPTISNNSISGNSASGGGGIHCTSNSNPTINGNNINGNTAIGGGGISCSGSSPTISNNTISGNSARSGGGIYCTNLSSPTISNTIIAFSSQGGAVFCDGSSSPVLDCCDVYGNSGGDWVGCIADQLGTNGNFSVDPLFCDTALDNYHLSNFSPCVPQNSPCGALVGALGTGCLYLCADANGDSLVNVDDVDFLMNFYFYDGATPFPYVASDLNCDGSVNIADITYLAAYINGTGAAPCCEQ